MVLNLACLVIIVLVGYMWLTRGFFSALIHFLCVIISGAVAFAAWEPVSHWLLGATSGTGFVDGSAWTLGLIVPFALCLAIIRPAMDRVLRGNVQVSDGVNYAGGGILGAGAGVISAGILAIGLSYMRVDYVGAYSFDYGSGGSIQRQGKLWVPVDKITAGLYGHLSERALRVNEPLAKWRPAVHEVGNANRISPFENKGRNTIRPDEFVVKGRFTVGKESKNFPSLTSDRWNTSAQLVNDPDGQPYPADTYIEGFVVSFQPGSKEKDGRTSVGGAQVQLVLENDAQERTVVFPFAVSSQAKPETPGVARWRYDGPSVFIATVGAASESMYAFEFPCPRGYHPIALYVKGVRHEVDDPATAKPRFEWSTAPERDAGLTALGLGQLAIAVTPVAESNAPRSTKPAIPGFDASSAVMIGTGQVAQSGAVVQTPGVNPSLTLPWTVQKGQHGNLELNEENNKNIILGGDLRIMRDELPEGGLEKPLVVRQFLADPTAVLVQIDVSGSSRLSLLGRSLDAAESLLPPMLVDTLGERYQPIGYIYEDESEVRVSFKPGEPITAMRQVPEISRSREKQRLILLFRVSFGREVRYFVKGSKVVNEFNPPIMLDTRQENR